MRQEGVQLRKNPYSNTGVFGTLELEGGRLTYKIDPRMASGLYARLSGGAFRWIERTLGFSNMKERLAAGETVQVFDFAATEAEVASVGSLMGTGFRIKSRGHNWVVVFQQVRGAASMGLNMPKGRRQVKEWKQALAAASGQPA
jgi:hypothetical protein